MPFIPNTPESRLARADSRDASTTCRGVTAGGRPCRRPLATTSPAAPPLPARGRVSRRPVDNPSDPDLYCWQHKDQASPSANSTPGPTSRTKVHPARQGSLRSLESLVGRLGIADTGRNGRVPNGDPQKPLHHRLNEKNSGSRYANSTHAPKPDQKPNVPKQTSFCCCFSIPEEEEKEASAPKPRPVQNAPANPSSAKLPSHHQHPAPPSAGQKPGDAASQTARYLSLIPKSALPETAATLLKELSKPISPTDEPGYIYIFWLTPESQPFAAPGDAARDLLAPPSGPDMRQRRTSDVLQSFAARSHQSGSASKTILLKIGRASNVQRRLNEWQRQCGYNISLVRYYPYVSSSQPSTPRKMPHSHKVERLIHIELEGQGLRVKPKANCPACGKNHREWFEVEGTIAGINTVDEIVRRWSDWDEGNQ